MTMKLSMSKLERRAGRYGMFAIIFAVEAAWATSLMQPTIAILSISLSVVTLTMALYHILGVDL